MPLAGGWYRNGMGERGPSFPPEDVVPANEREVSIPDRLRQLHEVEKHFLSRGVFFDVYEMELPDAQGNAEPFVFKDFQSGKTTMSPQEQVALFQHQYYEWVQLRASVGEQFFPESHWIRSGDFSDDQAHGFFAEPGKTANTLTEFVKVQLDRQLADRYSSDDTKKGAVKTVMSAVGSQLSNAHESRPFIGAIVQERVHGVSYNEALKQVDRSSPAFATLRENTRQLLRGLRRYHEENQIGAFTWHGLASDNVMVETDEQGKITGRVVVIDANFTERPNQAFRDGVLKKLKKNVFHPLEQELGLDDH